MSVKNLLSNEYYICLKGNQKPIYWDLSESEPKIKIDCSLTYFSRVFKFMEQSLDLKNLVFYLTWENLEQLPSYGENVVAIVLGDEWCRTPQYSHKIRATFKCYGTSPKLLCNPFLQPTYVNFITWVHFVKAWIVGLPGRLNYLFHFYQNQFFGTDKRFPAIYHIPLGYYNQMDLTTKELESRPYDVFFAGSLTRKPATIRHPVKFLRFFWRYWFSQKNISRQNLLRYVNQCQEKHPDLRFELSLSSGFGGKQGGIETESYSEKMMNTKVCLVPRGTSFETFRFFEALRYGCIPVTEALPSSWFYDGSPDIKLKDWSELEEVLTRLFANKHLMQEKHQECLNWWKSKCSEAVVGNYIAEKLNTTI
ncbi:MAG TPA: exostosin family protein [Xenococcaceae cyanobacterium]